MGRKLSPTKRAVQERFYFGDTVLPLFESGIPLMRQRMQSLPDADNITIAYPDEGAWKRFHYQFGDYPEASLVPVSLFSPQTDCNFRLRPVSLTASSLCHAQSAEIWSLHSCDV